MFIYFNIFYYIFETEKKIIKQILKIEYNEYS